jgi:uncharacterized protein (DUF169 family)
MAPHQERVVVEKKELDEKIEKLTAFKEGEVFAGLPVQEQERLSRQLRAMTEYSEILGERISEF